MPNFREIEEGWVGKRPFLQPLTWFGRIMGQSSLQLKTSLINKAHKTLRLELKTSKSIKRRL
jgi:hypothetical protein